MLRSAADRGGVSKHGKADRWMAWKAARLGGVYERVREMKKTYTDENRAIPEKLRVWIEAGKKYHLSPVHIQMARELGLNPKKLGKIANHKQEPWKAPLPEFIEHIYFKRFGKRQPDTVKKLG